MATNTTALAVSWTCGSPSPGRYFDDPSVQNGRNGILPSHLRWGDARRGCDVVPLGKGDTDWDKCMRSLNSAGYDAPLSIKWEDAGMDRVRGIREPLQFLRSAQFEPAEAAFDAALSS